MDASAIDPCLSLFPLTSFRNTKDEFKLDVAMRYQTNLPEFVTIAKARKHEVEENSIVATDRRHTDYPMYNTRSNNGGYFVAALKAKASSVLLSDET